MTLAHKAQSLDPDRQITAIIPTYKRPDRLIGALDSVLAQMVEGYALDILVVDNDVLQSAREAVQSRPGVRYIVEPASGVSNARNSGLAGTDARYVFFLDDDMLAEPGCIAGLMAGLSAYDAGVAFASVHARMPDDSTVSDAMRPFFSRSPEIAEGLTEKCMGAGGSLFDRKRCPFPDPAFDPRCNEVGGEDDLLLSHLMDEGVRFAWMPQARTQELVPTHRATLAYLWTRNFAFGQGPTQIAADRARDSGRLVDRLHIVKWMCIGTLQAMVRGPVWVLSKPVGGARFVRAHAQLAQALGKIFWWGGFQKKLYGASVAAPLNSRS